MGELLLISDNFQRTERLARQLGNFRPCHIHDLYEDTLPAVIPELIVSDVKDLGSNAILRLQRVLKNARHDGAPYLCLLHQNGARGHVQAELLGASVTLGVTAATHLLVCALTDLQERAEPVPAMTLRQAKMAQEFLREAFVPLRPITPTLADSGTEIVADAVRRGGIRHWIQAVRQFDDATHQHCLLVAGLAAAFSGVLGLHAIDRHRLAKAALLHDVGKIHVPTAILNKPGKLTTSEMAVMRTHPDHGHAMLVGQGFDDMVLAVVRSHHEMLDGSGYPNGLTGPEIPDLVRLVTVCDIYGALIERRPYRSPMNGAEAYGILAGMTGRVDKDLTRSFHPVATAFAHKSTA